MGAQRGFIALLSVLMTSGVLLVLSFAATIDTTLAEQAVTDEFSYRSSFLAAWSCARFAFERLSADPQRFTDQGTTTISFQPSGQCSIISATTTPTQAHTLVQGHAGESFVRLNVTAGRTSPSSPFKVSSWED